MVQEPDPEVLAAAFEALEELLDLGCRPGLLTQQQLVAVFGQFDSTLEASAQRWAERRERRASEDFDEDEAEALEVTHLRC